MSKAAELAALIANVNKGSSLAAKNFIINGNMSVAQRATSATASGNGTYNTIDRWITWDGNDGALTSEQSTDAPKGFSNSLKLVCTTADTSLAAGTYASFAQIIEAQNLQSLDYGSSDAKPITLSFWVKSSKTGTYCVAVEKQDSTQYRFVKEYTISSANTWEYKTVTILPDSNIKAGAGAIANDNGEGIRVLWSLGHGSTYTGATDNTWHTGNQYATNNQVNWMDSTSNNFFLTGCQLEIGEKATEFEHEPYETTLYKCLRYCEIHTLHSYTHMGFAYTTAQFLIPYTWKVEKRDAPTFTFPTVGTSSGNLGVTVASGSYPSTHGSVLRATTSVTQAYVYNNADDGYAGFTDDHIAVLYGYANPVVKIESEL
jgi:hypothetical protein